VSDAEVKRLLERNATGQVQPKDKEPSERAFYDRSLEVRNRLVLNADIKDLGNNLAVGYARQQQAVARGEKSVGSATLSAEDPTVEFKQNAITGLTKLHDRLLSDAITEARSRSDTALVEELKAEQKRGMLFLMGGDEITISLHVALKDKLADFAELLAHPGVANARVAVKRTGSGSQDGDANAVGSLKHALDAGVSMKTLKGYEEKQRELERALLGIPRGERRREGQAMIDGLGLTSLYVDVGLTDTTERAVIKRFPDGKPVSASFDDEIAEVKRWIEEHRE
jgi:hypothetical protein